MPPGSVSPGDCGRAIASSTARPLGGGGDPDRYLRAGAGSPREQVGQAARPTTGRIGLHDSCSSRPPGTSAARGGPPSGCAPHPAEVRIMPTGFYLWPENPGLSLAFWAALLVLAMFGARTPAHQAIHGLSRAVAHWCRLAAHAITHLQERVAARNREVLLSEGMQDRGAPDRAGVPPRISDYGRPRPRRISGATPAASPSRSLGSTRITVARPTPPLEPASWTHAVEVATRSRRRTELQGAAAKAVSAAQRGSRRRTTSSMTSTGRRAVSATSCWLRWRPAWRSHGRHALTRGQGGGEHLRAGSKHLDTSWSKYQEIAAASADGGAASSRHPP